MNIDDYKDSIKLLVTMIADNQYDSIDESILKTVSKQELQEKIKEYGRILISLPDEAFSLAEVYNIENDKRLDVYIPLYTKEEGRSDLTLFISCRTNDGKKELEINNIEVL